MVLSFQLGRQWQFEHVTSIPHYPAYLGKAESALIRPRLSSAAARLRLGKTEKTLGLQLYLIGTPNTGPVHDNILDRTFDYQEATLQMKPSLLSQCLPTARE